MIVEQTHELTRSKRDDNGGLLEVYAGEKYGTILKVITGLVDQEDRILSARTC